MLNIWDKVTIAIPIGNTGERRNLEKLVTGRVVDILDEGYLVYYPLKRKDAVWSIQSIFDFEGKSKEFNHHIVTALGKTGAELTKK
jgi:hypothetical protein